MQTTDKIIQFFCAPFTKLLPFFTALFIMTSAPDIVRHGELSQLKYCVYILACNFATDYFLVLLLNFAKGWCLKILCAIVMINATIWMMIGLWTHLILHSQFLKDMVAVIFGTNLDECTDFISVFMTGDYGLAIAGIIILSVLGYYIIYKFRRKITTPVFVRCMVACLVASVALTLYNHELLKISLPYKTSLFFQYKKAPDLRACLKNPDLLVDTDSMPANIVLIIGESHSRSHSSLYGYDKETNPRLKSFIERCDSTGDSKMLVFTDVSSNATWTIRAFQNIMSEFISEKDADDDWYKKLTLIEVLNKAGYHTEWISNQSKLSFFDNIILKYSELCDTAIFVGSGYHDEALIPKLDSLEIKSPKRFQIVHLEGSHTSYDSTFPKDRTKFLASDYPDYQVHQRQILADYDNSLLYNDSVLTQLFERYRESESIVIYLPDHGEDIFETNPHHFGHGLGNSLESRSVARRIPFFVFMSKDFIARYPQKANAIEISVNKHFNTTNMIYTVMDIASIAFADSTMNAKVYENTLLSH